MGPNDVEIVRVYTRQPKGDIADSTFATSEKCEVVVEAEAGSAIWAMGVPYWIGVSVRDLTDNTVKVYSTEEGSNLGGSKWEKKTYKKVFGPFTLKDISGLTKLQGAHCFEVLAYVRAGMQEPDVSFARSPLFMYYEPKRK